MDRTQNLKYDYTYRPPEHGRRPDAIAGVLSPGEKVLWSGQPSRKLFFFRKGDLALIPFALVWTGFSLVWEAGALAAVFDAGGFNPFAVCFPLFGVPFVLIGVYLLGGRFVGDYLVRRGTWYALTDRRVFALSTFRERNVVSIPLHKIDHVEITLHKDGRGTLAVHGRPDWDAKSWGARHVVNSAVTANGFPLFERIETPQQVYDAALEAQEAVWARRRNWKPEEG